MGVLVYEEMLRRLEEINRNLANDNHADWNLILLHLATINENLERQNQILDNLVSVTKLMLEDPDDIWDDKTYKEH